LYGVASTYTDTTSSGTIAAMAPFYALSAPTLSTSNVTTYSFASTLYVAGAPAAGGSATITNPYALYVNSGASYLAGVLGVGGVTTLGNNLLFGTDNTYDIGASGAKTGTAVLRVVPINTDGTNGTAVDLTLLTDTSSTRMNATFAGSSYQAVKVYITRTSTTASTITLTSMMARLVETGRSLTLTGSHAPGEGHTGLEFLDDARVESYTYMYPPRKGMSTNLVEVGAWR
jgi:hypothetical protein